MFPSSEDDGLVIVGEDLALDVPADGAGEHDFFEVAALADEVLHGLFVGDAADVLLDDRSFVQFGGDVVAGGSDDFHAAMVGGVIGFRAGEGGEEAVVDIDDAIRPSGADVVGEDLHVAGEDHGFDAVFLQQGKLPGFGLRFIGGGDGDDVEGDAEAFGGGAQGIVIGDDEGDVGFQFAGFVAAEEVVEAMRVLADKKGEAVALVAEVQAPGHAARLGEGADEDGEVFAGNDKMGQVPLGTHEEDPFLDVDMLVEMDDVAAVFRDEGGDGADEAGLVGTVDQEDGVWHGSSEVRDGRGISKGGSVERNDPVRTGEWQVSGTLKLIYNRIAGGGLKPKGWPMKPVRFPLLNFPLAPLRSVADRLTEGVPTKLRKLLQEADYPVRLLRYWWAAQALRAESLRLGRPLQVVDLGCERGWLKHFTPEGVVDRWIGIDWVVQPEINRLAKYDEVHAASFDGRLPKEDAVADAVVSLHVFEHLPRPGWTMAEVSRMLKPGGIFLGAAPTMPNWVAKLRERYFRRRLAAGEVAVGGHITVLSPQRWRALAYDCGLNVEFATGSHFIRKTGSKLENHRWWVRLNQLWGALFPSLGSECCVQARRAALWQEQTDRLLPEDPHWRRWWIGLGLTALVGLIASPFLVAKVLEDRKTGKLTAWLDRHQKAGDVFLIHDNGIGELRAKRSDYQFADTLPELLALVDRHPDAHVLVSAVTAGQLAAQDNDNRWKIKSRLDVSGGDYLLVKRGTEGTPLLEYLAGTMAEDPARQR